MAVTYPTHNANRIMSLNPIRLAKRATRIVVRAAGSEMDRKAEPAKLIPCSESLGADHALVFIQGFGSKEKCYPRNYTKSIQRLRSAGWRGSIYQLWWDSCTVADRNDLTDVAYRWIWARRNAKRTGKEDFSELIARLPEKHVSIISFSLGARVAYFGLREAHALNKEVEDLIMIAGAERRGRKNWDTVIDRLNGRLINLRNSKDKKLKRHFRAKITRHGLPRLRGHAVGRKRIKKAIKYAPDRVLDVNLKRTLKSLDAGKHKGIWKHADTILPLVGWPLATPNHVKPSLVAPVADPVLVTQS